MAEILDAYRAVNERVCLFDRSRRVRLSIGGPDRAKFLHNLTTNEIKRLAPGAGVEAFVTSPQGKTLGYVTILAAEDQLLVRTESGGLAALLPHLEKYGVFDDVSIVDRSGETFELHLAGPRAEELIRLAASGLPGGEDLGHVLARVGERTTRIVRESPTGRPGFTLIGDLADAPDVRESLSARGAAFGLVESDGATFDTLRIEAGTPVYGLDVTEASLPQELARDSRTINFVKGCYLGQETVARIDALGHVNRFLRGLRLEGEGVLERGAAVEADEKAVGTITSAAFSPGWGTAVALAYVRTTHAQPGTKVLVRSGDRSFPAVVTELPMVPSS